MDVNVDLVLENEGLVHGIISKYQGYFDKDDLYQEGMKALVKAAKNYNQHLGVKFSTYAYKYIFGEVNKYIRENNNVKISKEVMKLKRSIENARDLMRQRLLRDPTILELSLYLEIEEDKIREIDQIYQETKSLDYTQDGENIDLYHYVQTTDKETTPEILDLKQELENLDENELQLIYSRYYMDMTQTETSKKLGMSQVQVYRKETKILEKLKNNL